MIINDGAKQLFHNLKTTIVHYPHDGYSGETEEEFWHEDDGWTNGREIGAVVQESPFPMLAYSGDERVTRRGQEDTAGVELWLLEDVIDEGDLLEWNNDEWIVTKTLAREVSGEFFAYEVTAKQHEG